jgi:metal-sulfur cluster biosynthetic enzyme
MSREQALLAALREVEDPETGLNVVDMGLIYAVAQPDDSPLVSVTMTFTSPFCPAGEVLLEGIERRLARLPGVGQVEVEVTFEPPWTPARVSDEGKRFLGW